MTIKKLQRHRVHADEWIGLEDGSYCTAEDVTELEATNAELVRLLGLAWQGIVEAGYEGHSFDLQDEIEKYID